MHALKERSFCILHKLHIMGPLRVACPIQYRIQLLQNKTHRVQSHGSKRHPLLLKARVATPETEEGGLCDPEAAALIMAALPAADMVDSIGAADAAAGESPGLWRPAPALPPCTTLRCHACPQSVFVDSCCAGSAVAAVVEHLPPSSHTLLHACKDPFAVILSGC